MLAAGSLAKRFGYSGLLITLFALMFVGPLFAESDWEAVVLGVLAITTAGCAMYAAGGSPRTQAAFGLLALAYVISYFGDTYSAVPQWQMVHSGVGALFFTSVALVLLTRIMSVHTRVTGELIAGSVAVYLLLGIVFAYLFELVNLISPGSFSFVDRPVLEDPDFFYFSLVTLTTLGYGDITPLAPIARGLATLEALIGPLYLTVLVARLVGMRISIGPGSPDGP